MEAQSKNQGDTNTGREQRQALLRGIREKALKKLARSSRVETLAYLHGYLHQYGLYDYIRQGEDRAAAGDLETTEGLRSFINSIV